jgi:hypothetical protein
VISTVQSLDEVTYFYTIDYMQRHFVIAVSPYCGTDTEIAWLANAISSRPNREGGFIGHRIFSALSGSYIQTAGDGACTTGHAPRNWWDNWLKFIPNLVFMASGHESGSTTLDNPAAGNYAVGSNTASDGHSVTGIYMDLEAVDRTGPWTLGTHDCCFLGLITFPGLGTGNVEARIMGSNTGNWVAAPPGPQPGSYNVPLYTHAYAATVEPYFAARAQGSGAFRGSGAIR